MISGQSRLFSMIEAAANIGSGVVISFLLQWLVVFPLWNIEVGILDNLAIVAIFTAVSMLRSYFWRRYFNKQWLKRYDIE